MDYTYSFEAHLREHRPSRLGQRLWWMPAAGGVVVIIASGGYLVATPSAHLSPTVGGALPCIAAFLFLLAWAALSIADWTYSSEKHYREAQHAAASQIRAYILAGRRSRGEAHIPRMTNERRVTPSGADAVVLRQHASTPHPRPHPGSGAGKQSVEFGPLVATAQTREIPTPAADVGHAASGW